MYNAHDREIFDRLVERLGFPVLDIGGIEGEVGVLSDAIIQSVSIARINEIEARKKSAIRREQIVTDPIHFFYLRTTVVVAKSAFVEYRFLNGHGVAMAYVKPEAKPGSWAPMVTICDIEDERIWQLDENTPAILRSKRSSEIPGLLSPEVPGLLNDIAGRPSRLGIKRAAALSVPAITQEDINALKESYSL